MRELRDTEKKIELQDEERNSTLKIAVLSCLKATEICCGLACFKALNERSSYFSEYEEKDIELIAFFHCNGCNCDYKTDSSYIEKMNTLIKLSPDIIHIGKCTIIKDSECKVITMMAEQFKLNNITIKRGTH